jgi:polyhydroxybutyrate depolymerase
MGLRHRRKIWQCAWLEMTSKTIRSCRGVAGAVLLALFAAAHAGAIPNAAPTAPPTQTVRVGAMTRRFLAFVPPSLQPGTPLLIAFHPSGATGAGMRRICGDLLERLARQRQFAVAYPDGFEGHFDDLRRKASYSARRLKIDDVGFTRAIVAFMNRKYGIDPDRVYALGYSNGGAMVLRLALESPDLVAGVISISANLPTADNIDCPIIDGRHTAVVLIEGTADPINPYQGGRVSIFGLGDRGTVLSAQKSAEWFARRYGLQRDLRPKPVLKQGTLNATWQDWGSSPPLVRLITIQGGGHTVPKAPRPGVTILLGRTFRSDALIEAAWDVMPGSGAKAAK